MIGKTMNKQLITIVVADDDEDDRALVKFALAECTLPSIVYFVEDGEQLLDYLNRRGLYKDQAKSVRPDLILLDLDMPRMDGHEALKEIKGDSSLRSIPIVIFTTSKEMEDINSTYNLGANSFIVKPVTYAELVRMMKVLSEYWFEVAQLPLVQTPLASQ